MVFDKFAMFNLNAHETDNLAHCGQEVKFVIVTL